jgi:hypothetical protein
VARIRSRLVAFGSTDAIDALDRVGALDKEAFAWVLEPPRLANFDAWRSKTDEAIENLRTELTEFERRLNHELTS